MKDLFDYIEDAKQRTGLKSDAQLAKMMGLGRNAISFYRKRNVFPNDETMLKLAKIGGNDAETALLDLNIWRSPEKTKGIYTKLRDMVEQSAATLAVLVMLACPAFASNAMQVSHETQASIYYGK